MPLDMDAVATRHGQRRVLVALCVTEITSWGILFYAFPVLAGRITASTGWSATAITAAFSAGQLVSAGVGVAVGRVLDRRGPRAVMTAGSVLGVLAVVVIATAQNLAWFFGGWLLAGAAMAATLYPPAFAALTRRHGPDRVRARSPAARTSAPAPCWSFWRWPRPSRCSVCSPR